MQINWNKVRVILKKELRDHRRDLRSVLLSLFFPLMAPVMLGLLLYFSTGGQGTTVGADPAAGPKLTVPIIGMERSQGLQDWLDDQGGITLKPLGASLSEAEAMVRDGTYSFILIVAGGTAGDARPVFNLLHDRAQTRSVLLSAEVLETLGRYVRHAGDEELTRAGVDPRIANPVRIVQVDVGQGGDVAQLFYRMAPPLMLFMIFMGAVYLAIDITVGERERGSLEPLLTAPLTREEVVLAKGMAAFLFTALIVAINLLAFTVVLHLAAAGNPRVAAPPGFSAFAACYGIALPLIVLAVSLQMTVAAVTRSAKEAQIYLGLLPLVPLVPGLYLVFQPGKGSLATEVAPILGQLSLFVDLMTGQAPAPAAIIGASVVTLIAGVAVFALAVRLFRREDFVFSA